VNEVQLPYVIHGRLMEAVHVTGYTMGRACVSLEYLLEDDRWKTLGDGFEDIDRFLETIDLSQFKIAVDKRKKLAKKLGELQATQRATAKALGVTKSTVNRDLQPVPSGTKESVASDIGIPEKETVPDGTPAPPPVLSMAGEDAVRKLERSTKLPKERDPDVEIPDGKYPIIYVDPPWKYTSGDQHTDTTQETVIGTHYPSLTIAELCALPVKDLAHTDAVMFMWVTSPLLEEAFDVIKAWGFDYKTSMVWDKVRHNVGNYVSVRHEFILICARGTAPKVAHLVDSVYEEERTVHSRKPAYFRNLMDELFPDGPRIELFAREKCEGWDSWGDEL